MFTGDAFPKLTDLSDFSSNSLKRRTRKENYYWKNNILKFNFKRKKQKSFDQKIKNVSSKDPR